MELALGVVILVILVLTGSGGTPPENGDGANGGNGGGNGGGGTKPHRGPDGRGHAWTNDEIWNDIKDAKKLPDGSVFDYGGNGFYIDPDCGWVIEGDRFWPESQDFSYQAVERPSLEATLAHSRTNSVIGFVDYLMNQEGMDDPVEIVWRVLEEAAPLCADVDPSQWGGAMRYWFDDFLKRVTRYVETGDTIPLGG